MIGIRDNEGKFQSISYRHIFRQFNSEADIPSKNALDNVEGHMYFEEVFDSQVVARGSIQVFKSGLLPVDSFLF